MPIVKEVYFNTSVITILSNFLLCVFLLSTKIYAKRVECIYNHNAKFSLHAKTSVITLSFIMYKVPSDQRGKLQMTILIYSPCSIQ